jgi:hypothetical protein
MDAPKDIEPWKFATPPAKPRSPQVTLFVFGAGPLVGDAAMSSKHFGAASQDSLAVCEVRHIQRAADPGWFDGWRQGSVRNIAKGDLGEELAVLDAVDYVHVIRAEPQAPADLTYLQAAWAMARYFVARGGSIVLDAHAMTFLRAESVQRAGEPLDVTREVRVVYETETTRPDDAHALHTRGMRKFGAPDLVALCTDADVRLVAHAMRELADQVARGTELATPKHAVHVAPGVTWVAVEDEHRLADVLSLNNEARVLVDDRGHDLMNVMSRLPLPS